MLDDADVSVSSGCWGVGAFGKMLVRPRWIYPELLLLLKRLDLGLLPGDLFLHSPFLLLLHKHSLFFLLLLFVHPFLLVDRHL